MVKRKTMRKRKRAKLQEIKKQLRMRMHAPVRETGEWLRTIRRRSQQHRMTWRRYYELERRFLPKAHTYHPFPNVRLAAQHPR